MKNKSLWYEKAAKPWIWEEALPLGNGKLGAMVFGGVDEELIQLNQDTVWYGAARERVNPSALETLPKVRQLLFEGRLQEAEKLAYAGLYATPMSQGHYEPLADFKIVFQGSIPHHSEYGQERTLNYSNYMRMLSLAEGLHHVSYDLEGVAYSRESFISYQGQVMAIRLSTSGKEVMNLRLELSRGDNFESVKTIDDDSIVLEGYSGGQGSHFMTMIKVASCDGQIEALGSYINIINASEIVIFVTGQTDFDGVDPYIWCLETLQVATQAGYGRLRDDHIQDYQELFKGMDLDISQDINYEDIPTDLRLKRLAEGKEDEGLYELYFNYGRYLLIACSRPGSMPANLQGIWNKEMQPPWGSKYTININTQMNYWHAEMTNLSECHEPLFEHLLRMLPRGQQVARKMYGCRGFVAHHNTDIYGDCAPQDQWMPATIWPMGAAWLTTHILEHYAYTKDKTFLNKYYVVIAETALFFIDYLIEDEEGQLVTSPSTSPENTYLLENQEKSALCFGPTMDTQIIKQLWRGFLETSQVLGIENEHTRSVELLINKLPKIQIGSRGQIMEWTKEYEEWEPGHRHISHLYALHPGHDITNEGSPALFEAAKVTLQERLAHGGGHTGWSRAWIINMWARLLEPEKAYENLNLLLTHSTAVNLFDMHPPFQIDGNFGGAAGLAELLIQSHEGFIRLLPALPKAWSKGHIKGFRVRGAMEVDLVWEHGQVKEVTVKALEDTTLKILLGGVMVEASLRKNEIKNIPC